MLTFNQITTSLNLSLPHEAVGIGVPESHGVSRFHAVFLRAKSQFSVMLGWAGSRKTGRVVCPVRQPVQSDTIIGVMWSGLKPLHTVAIMPNNHTQKPTKINTQTSSVNLRSLIPLIKIDHTVIAGGEA